MKAVGGGHWLAVGLALVAALSLELLIGASGFGWPSDPFIGWQLRVPRTLLAAGAGAGLAACGLLLQVLLRNPLASPYTLGVGSGAALGASIAITVGAGITTTPALRSGALVVAVLGLAWMTRPVDRRAMWITLLAGFVAVVVMGWRGGEGVGAGAWLGALIATMAVLGIQRRSGLGGEALVLGGIAIALCCSAGVLLLHVLADGAASSAMLRWTMGGLASVGMESGLSGLLPTLVGGAWMLRLLPQLNLLQLGEDWAETRGVAVAPLQRAILVAVALWTGSIVAMAGPVSFVGLIAPHMARRLVGDDLRLMAPTAALLGATLLASCDAAARLIMMPAELPVGVLTALLGGPTFVAMLVWRKA